MRVERDDSTRAYKALPIFSTMRANLAMVDAFLRDSYIDMDSQENDHNLMFLGIKPSKEQFRIHNRSVATIMTSLLCQVFQNYFDMKRVKAELEDSGVEEFLNNLDNKDDFIEGMRVIRNSTFHVPNPRQMRHKSVRVFQDTCNQRGGVFAVITEMRGVLYDFTQKVFLGELMIWPATVYEDIEQFNREKPDINEKFESGEIGFLELMEAMWEWKDLNI